MNENTNIKAGDCIDCGNYWTVTGGGLNDAEQCPECERKYSAAPCHQVLADELAANGSGLGDC